MLESLLVILFIGSVFISYYLGKSAGYNKLTNSIKLLMELPIVEFRFKLGSREMVAHLLDVNENEKSNTEPK